MISDLTLDLRKSPTFQFALPTIKKQFGKRYTNSQTERAQRATNAKSQFIERIKREISKDE
jgi:hypothetical protein